MICGFSIYQYSSEIKYKKSVQQKHNLLFLLTKAEPCKLLLNDAGNVWRKNVRCGLKTYKLTVQNVHYRRWKDAVRRQWSLSVITGRGMPSISHKGSPNFRW